MHPLGATETILLPSCRDEEFAASQRYMSKCNTAIALCLGSPWLAIVSPWDFHGGCRDSRIAKAQEL